MIRKIIDDAPRFAMLPGEEVVEISKHWYYQLLNGVPPIRNEDGGFFIGEPERCVQRGDGYVLTFTFCFTYCGRFYATSPKALSDGSNVKLINDAIRVINKHATDPRFESVFMETIENRNQGQWNRGVTDDGYIYEMFLEYREDDAVLHISVDGRYFRKIVSEYTKDDEMYDVLLSIIENIKKEK